jgi:hypothetical protein
LSFGRFGVYGKLIFRMKNKIVHASGRCVQEKGFAFNPEILELPDNVCLDGYWQSEKYLKGSVAKLL